MELLQSHIAKGIDIGRIEKIWVCFLQLTTISSRKNELQESQLLMLTDLSCVTFEPYYLYSRGMCVPFLFIKFFYVNFAVDISASHSHLTSTLLIGNQLTNICQESVKASIKKFYGVSSPVEDAFSQFGSLTFCCQKILQRDMFLDYQGKVLNKINVTILFYFP